MSLSSAECVAFIKEVLRMEPPNSGYPKLGKMLVPKNFKYTDVLQRGRPQPYNSRMARENRVMVRVISFVPCTDENHFAFRIAAGKYETTAGMVLRVEPDSLRLRTENGDRNILFCDLREIQSEAGIFNRAWAET